MKFVGFIETHLECDSIAFNLRHILEDRVHDVEELGSIQWTGLILLEKVDKIVQYKVSSCNIKKTYTILEILHTILEF